MYRGRAPSCLNEVAGRVRAEVSRLGRQEVSVPNAIMGLACGTKYLELWEMVPGSL